MAGASLCLRCMTPMQNSSSCPRCGWRDEGVYDLQYARPGTVLSGRYLLGEYLRKNGEGALYAGFDSSVQQKVWIREYFPQTIAQRDLNTGKISPLSGCGAQYKALMSDFVDICNETRRLGVTEPVVPLENVISENNTVYAIFKGLDLIDFEEYMERQGGKLLPNQAVSLLVPICHTLGTLHAHGHIHRGISPHTIFVDSQGALYLWDFALSATRTAGSELDAELFSGYSAPEQYSPSGWQGSWTDIYAMGALLYRAVAGIAPPKSTRITPEHPLTPLAQLLPDLPRNISDAVSAAMHPDTEERTQAIQSFVSRLIEPKASNTAVFDTNKVARAGQSERERQSPGPRRKKSRGGTGKYVFLGMAVMLIVLGGTIWWFVTEIMPDIVNPQQTTGPAPVEESSQVSQEEQSQAANPLIMPDFFGKQIGDVENNPDYSRFDFSVEEVFDDDYGAGTIVDQSPLDGNSIPSTGRVPVLLKVSKGAVMHEMPDLVGRPLEEALEILDNLEEVRVETYDRYDSTAEAGAVLSTSPEAEVEFDPKRRTVIIFFAKEPDTVDASSQANRPGDSGSRNEDDILIDIDRPDYSEDPWGR